MGTVVTAVTTPRVALTRREVEVASWLGRGYSARHVARELFISYRTVETHRATIFLKMGITSRDELIAAFERGELSPVKAVAA